MLRRASLASASAAVAIAASVSATSSTLSSSCPPRLPLRGPPFPLLPRRSHRSSRSGRSYLCAPVAVFTGIVQGTATVSSLEKKGSASGTGAAAETVSSPSESATLTLALPPGALVGVSPGGSIAVNGTCLTVVTADEARSVTTFDVIGETLRATSLGELKAGSRANFERAARVGDEIGGHLVSGHVCCVGRVEEVERLNGNGRVGGDGNENNNGEGNVRMRFRVPSLWGKYILPKGFISLDGCSLTVGPDVETEKGSENDENQATTLFLVFFIPETLRVTRFGEVRVGDVVNVEVDATTQAVVDTVERVVDARIEERLAGRLGV